MRGWVRLVVATVVVALLAGAGEEYARAGSTPAPERAVAMLNQWRQQVGLQPVAHDQVQSEGCRLHARYHRLNQSSRGHFEDPARSGYTEAGHRAAASSVLAYGDVGRDGPLEWEDAVYHRAGLLDPRLTTTGYWAEHSLACMGVFGDGPRTEPRLTAHPYPYDGQRGIAPVFECNEVPNPCESVPGNDGDTPIGFIPSLQLNGPWSDILGVDVASAVLQRRGGAEVPLTIEDARSPRGALVDHGVALIPHRRLAGRAWYGVRVTGTLRVYDDSLDGGGTASEPFSTAWRFQTAPLDRSVALRARFVRTTSQIVRLRITAPRPVRGRVATVSARADGAVLSRRRVRLRSVTEVTLRARRIVPSRIRIRVPSFLRGPFRYEVRPLGFILRWS